MILKTLFFVCFIYISFSASASTTHLREVYGADGSRRLELRAGPGPVKSKPKKLNEDLVIRKEIVDFFGYEEGNYLNYYTGDEMISRQILESLNSEPIVAEYKIPKAIKMVAGINELTRAESKAALIFDHLGKLIAVGLVSRDCRWPKYNEKICNDASGQILTIFLPKGSLRYTAEPIIQWSKIMPEIVALYADQSNPDVIARVQKIAKINYITTNPSQPSWNQSDLPSDFPRELRSLLPVQSSLVGAGTIGKFTTGQLKGFSFSKSSLYRAEGPMHDYEVLLRTYTPIDEILNFYKNRAHMVFGSTYNNTATFNGETDSQKFILEISTQDFPHSANYISLFSWKK